MVLVIIGVSGSGKTTIGHLLAQQLSWIFRDADEFHSLGNVEKMRRGIALTDADRDSWLERLRSLIAESIGRGENMVLACSALKQKYRDRLQVGNEVKWVLLKGDYDVILERLTHRQHHFMNPDLLRSQFDTLEEPTGPAIVVDIKLTPEQIVHTIRKGLQI